MYDFRAMSLDLTNTCRHLHRSGHCEDLSTTSPRTPHFPSRFLFHMRGEGTFHGRESAQSIVFKFHRGLRPRPFLPFLSPSEQSPFRSALACSFLKLSFFPVLLDVTVDSGVLESLMTCPPENNDESFPFSVRARSRYDLEERLLADPTCPSSRIGQNCTAAVFLDEARGKSISTLILFPRMLYK